MHDLLSAIISGPSLVREQWLSPELAIREVIAFERRFGLKHLLLACHAALPFIVTPELLNLIHINFLDRENIPSIAEADFLLSPLCRPLGDEMFEVEPQIREVLLVELGNRANLQRPFEIASLLRAFLDKKSDWQQPLSITHLQRWIAQAYLDPDSVIHEMSVMLEKSFSSEGEQILNLSSHIQITTALEIVAEPLERAHSRITHQYLLNNSRAVSYILYGDENLPETNHAHKVSQLEKQENVAIFLSPALLKWFEKNGKKISENSDTNLKKTDFDRTLHRIRLMMEEGQEEVAFASLEAIQTDDPKLQHEINYIHAWYYTRKEQWEKAVQYLEPLYNTRAIEVDWNDADHTERERRAFYLLWLGNAAVNVSRYEDAAEYFTQCLKILEKRGVHLPVVRIKALCGQGMTCIMFGLYAVAIQYYKEALAVCVKEKLQERLREDVADIYYGLSDAYRLSGDFDSAYTCGKTALQLYGDLHDRYMECRVQNLLGRIAYQLGEHRTAADDYMESLSIATLDNLPGMQLINFIAMADLRLAENRLDEAQRYCERAQEASKQKHDDHQICGMMYIVAGKIAQAEAKQAQGQEQCFQLQEALAAYQKAEAHLTQTQAATHLSELYGRLAETYEALEKPAEALAHWKLAFDAVANAKG